jgi:hypothetical protein
MCVDISPDRRFVREAVFPCGDVRFSGIEPFQIIVPLTPPGDSPEGAPVPIAEDDPLFQKWVGLLKRLP